MVEFKINAFKSSEPAFTIQNGKLRLDKFMDDISVASQEGIAKALKKGEDIARQYNGTVEANLGYSSSSQVSHKINENRQSGYVALSGANVLYEEFGTGDVGANDGHPIKGDFPFLNPYNSGQYIRTNDKGEHYWFYKGMVGGSSPYYDPDTGYTRGIPSGKQMYKTSRWLRVEAKKIVQEEIKKAFKGKNI